MSYSIEFNPEAIADLAKIDRTNQLRIARKIKWLGENFEQITPLSLTGNLSSFFKLRIGDYRAIYTIARSQKNIIIHQIGHRREIYASLLAIAPLSNPKNHDRLSTKIKQRSPTQYLKITIAIPQKLKSDRALFKLFGQLRLI
jgi:mRNA interferase RelE/StbE